MRHIEFRPFEERENVAAWLDEWMHVHPALRFMIYWWAVTLLVGGVAIGFVIGVLVS